jgi:acyl-coenzyme A thioesterase PaaI-like protein
VESLKTKWLRWRLNLFPAYRGTGARVMYIADDFHEVRIKLPLNWRTRNYVGTIFGGSMYGAVDPIYMVMLINILGRDYVVWDKSAQVRFKRPGKETLFANFLITPEDIEAIKAELNEKKSLDRVYEIALTNEAGKVHAEFEKTIYIARKERNTKA